MIRRYLRVALALTLSVGAGGPARTTDAPAAAASASDSATYVGVGRCADCHRSERRGAQVRLWSESAHARAFTALAGPKAAKIAARARVAVPQRDPACLRCHGTRGALGAGFVPAAADSQGVGCEACHGPGSRYAPRAVMEDIRAGRASAGRYGLVRPGPATCAACHNRDAHGAGMVKWPADSAKIAHGIPPGLDEELERER